MIMNKYWKYAEWYGEPWKQNGRVFWTMTASFLNGCSWLLPVPILTGRRMSVTCPWPVFKVFSNTKHWGCNANNILNPEDGREIMELKVSKVWHSFKLLVKWTSLKHVRMNTAHWLLKCYVVHSCSTGSLNESESHINFLNFRWPADREVCRLKCQL